MDIKKAWENKTVRISVIGAALMVLIVVISQSIFTTPVKKEKKTQKKDMQTGFLIDDSQMNKLVWLCWGLFIDVVAWSACIEIAITIS